MGLEAADVPALLSECRYFIASVHPAIRRPESTPPHRGGHLVLITAADAQSVTFHNPSGDSPATRERVCPAQPLRPFLCRPRHRHRIKKRAVSDENSALSAVLMHYHASRITQASACRS